MSTSQATVTERPTTGRPAADPSTTDRRTAALLEIRDLHVTFAGGVTAVDGVSLTVGAGETLAIVGESGSGKSTLARAILGLLTPDRPAKRRTKTSGTRITNTTAVSTTAVSTTATSTARPKVDGSIIFAGRDIGQLSPRDLRTMRGVDIGFVPQDPMVSLNPVVRIGAQVAEVLRIHGLARGQAAQRQVIERLEAVGLPDPARVVASYPHELSGGMRQRVLIAMALVAGPRLVVADEPTSALDVTVQRRVLDDLAAATARLGTAVILVTHDLGVAADRAGRIAVMSQGRIVEAGATAEILRAPNHPYTRMLLASAPNLAAQPHSLDIQPHHRNIQPHNRPHNRIMTSSTTAAPSASPSEDPKSAGRDIGIVLRAAHLTKIFAAHGKSRPEKRAVDDVSVVIPRGSTVALVGESGSGKSTTARMLLGLEKPTGGTVEIAGIDPATTTARELRELRRHIQPIFQSPFASFDPRMRIGQAIAEPLRAYRARRAGEANRARSADEANRARSADEANSPRNRVEELADLVALPPQLLDRRPGEVSGGQLQRAAIARALALNPDVVICDEPVSALDASLQMQIIDLLARLQEELGLSYLLISHDLAVVRRLASTVCVMRGGRIVDQGSTDQIFRHPAEPYTKELLAAIPGQRWRHTARPATQIQEEKK